MVSNRKVALVTGGSGSIGTATVNLFIQEGWEVVVIDRVGSGGSAPSYFQCDLGNSEEVNVLVNKIQKKYSRIDALVNNAAEQLCSSLVRTQVAAWDRIMAVNVRAAYQLAVGCFPLLQSAKGAIVNISSVHAQVTSKGLGAYAASKGALTSLTRSMALEFAGDGIRVNAIMPGAIDTPMLREGFSRFGLESSDTYEKASHEILAAKHPLKRIGHPAEAAQAVFFLADSARSSFITGQVLIVDGGACVRLSTE